MGSEGICADWNWRHSPQNRRLSRSVELEDLYYGEFRIVGKKRKLYRGVPLGEEAVTPQLSVDTSTFSEQDRSLQLQKLAENWDSLRAPRPQWQIEPVLLYSAKRNSYQPAWEARPVSPDLQFLYMDYLEPETGKLLWRKPLYRRLSAKVYPTSPYGDGTNTAPPEVKVLPSLSNGATSIATDYMLVKRQQRGAVSGFELVDVDPNTDFQSSMDFSTDPGSFTSTCRGTSTQCPNQGFDAVNVFYHVEGYRERVAQVLSDIGETVDFANDPIAVLVNAIGFDTDGDGETSDEVNNAFFTSYCSSGTFTGSCLLFNPPRAVSYSSCGGVKAYYDLAREAVVAVHEYQHYITDTLTGLESDADGANVGDVLHEGYSDYFAVSQVSRMAAQETSTILQYGFQNCPIYQRTIGTLKVFDAASSRVDPHYYGWTWASGLFQLNKDLGYSIVDKIAMKSLFYLPTKPSFMEAIEALVQADIELYSGEHVQKIRTLFYDTLKFNGGAESPFSDPAKGIVYIGTSSCLSVAAISVNPVSPFATGTLSVLWLAALIGFSRRMRSFRPFSKKENADA